MVLFSLKGLMTLKYSRSSFEFKWVGDSKTYQDLIINTNMEGSTIEK